MTDERKAFNIFVGYRLYKGKDWIGDLEKYPKVDIKIDSPDPDTVINQVRTRVRGKIANYAALDDDYKNKVNSSIPILPFNKGKDIISVNRKDCF
jgi:hypothetical protein